MVYNSLNRWMMSDKIQAVKMQQDWGTQGQAKQAFKITKYVNPNVEQYEIKGEWTEEENMNYVTFLKKNANLIQGKHSGKLWNMFKRMAKFVKTRNFLQCKSHHQKMLAKFETIPDILLYFSLNADLTKSQNLQNKSQLIFPLNVSRKQQIHKVEEVNEPIFKPLIIQPMPHTPFKTIDLAPTKEEYEEEQNKWRAAKNMQQIPQSAFVSSETSLGLMGPLSRPIDRRKQWLECHAIFLMWASKLSKLTSSSTH